MSVHLDGLLEGFMAGNPYQVLEQFFLKNKNFCTFFIYCYDLKVTLTEAFLNYPIFKSIL